MPYFPFCCNIHTDEFEGDEFDEKYFSILSGTWVVADGKATTEDSMAIVKYTPGCPGNRNARVQVSQGETDTWGDPNKIRVYVCGNEDLSKNICVEFTNQPADPDEALCANVRIYDSEVLLFDYSLLISVAGTDRFIVDFDESVTPNVLTVYSTAAEVGSPFPITLTEDHGRTIGFGTGAGITSAVEFELISIDRLKPPLSESPTSTCPCNPPGDFNPCYHNSPCGHSTLNTDSGFNPNFDWFGNGDGFPLGDDSPYWVYSDSPISAEYTHPGSGFCGPIEFDSLRPDNQQRYFRVTQCPNSVTVRAEISNASTHRPSSAVVTVRGECEADEDFEYEAEVATTPSDPLSACMSGNCDEDVPEPCASGDSAFIEHTFTDLPLGFYSVEFDVVELGWCACTNFLDPVFPPHVPQVVYYVEITGDAEIMSACPSEE